MFDKYVIDGVVNGAAVVVRKISDIGGWFDKNIIDGLVNLSAGIVNFFGMIFRKIQTGTIQTYIAFLVFGIIILYFIFRVF